MIVEQMTDLIGNTPMLKIPASVHGLKNIDLYAKLEMMNPFGSVKDRIAWGMIKDDIKELQAAQKTIYENSSGNTAKALQAIAGIYGLNVKLVTNLAKVEEVKDIIRMMGAEIEEIQGASDCFDPNDPNDPQYIIEREVNGNPDKAYFPSQFTNEKNPQAHYETTGEEIARDLGSVDFLIGGLGTSGTTLGAAQYIKEHTNPEIRTIGVYADKGDFIPGIRPLDQLWESGLFVKEHYSELVCVNSTDSTHAMMDLVKKCGVLCGPTSGASYLGALNYLRGLDDGLKEKKKAVFIVCDRMEWYTDYIKERCPEYFGQRHKEGSIKTFKAPANSNYIVPAETADQWIDENNPTIIDVRGNLAYKMGSIPGAINIPLDFLEKMIDGADAFPKDTPILLICPLGEKTVHYAAYLQSRGYKAFTLEGGILEWRNQNKPLKKTG